MTMHKFSGIPLHVIAFSIIHGATAAEPLDATDRAALEELHTQVEAERKVDPEFPVENVLNRLRVNIMSVNVDRHNLKQPKPDNIPSDEWAALSKIHAREGEHTYANYALLDVDGDGKRDLIMEVRVGGREVENKHCSNTVVLLRRGDDFISPSKEAHPIFDESHPVLSHPIFDETLPIFGKCLVGRNQEGSWIRIKNRIYAAYRDGAIGSDTVTLVRPFHALLPEPTLYVRYRYDIQKICDSEHKPVCNALEKEDVKGAYSREDGLYFRPGVSQAHKNGKLIEWGTGKTDRKIRRAAISTEAVMENNPPRHNWKYYEDKY